MQHQHIRDRMRSTSLKDKATHYNDDTSYLLEILEKVQKHEKLKQEEREELERLRKLEQKVIGFVLDVGYYPRLMA